MSTARRGLSKSRIIAGLQCPRRLWLIANRPQAAVWSAESRRRLAVGHRLGEAARGLYLGGELIDEGAGGLRRALALTRARLAQPADLTLFEPAFERDGTLVRVDVLQRRAGACHMVEVKASSALKEYQVTDAAVQAWVVAGSVCLRSVAVAHVDTSFVYAGDGDYRGLLKEVDVTQRVQPIVARMPATAAGLQRMLAAPCPQKDPGRRCFDPFPCEFFADCGLDDAEYPVATLPGDLPLVAQLLAEGYVDLRDVPLGRLTDPVHGRLRRAAAGGAAELRAAAAHALGRLAFPRRFFAVRALNPPVPIWAATRPYQTQPFQFSCHLQARAGDQHLDHAEFLGASGTDPAPAFAEAALAALGEEGPIIVYGDQERAALQSLAARLPDRAEWVRAALGRLVDVQQLVRDNYYHPDMRGSFALHDVARAADLQLGANAVLQGLQEDLAAQDAWAALAVSAPEEADWDEQRRANMRQALLAGCAADTFAVARLVRFLEGAASPSH